MVELTLFGFDWTLDYIKDAIKGPCYTVNYPNLKKTDRPYRVSKTTKLERCGTRTYGEQKGLNCITDPRAASTSGDSSDFALLSACCLTRISRTVAFWLPAGFRRRMFLRPALLACLHPALRSRWPSLQVFVFVVWGWRAATADPQSAGRFARRSHTVASALRRQDTACCLAQCSRLRSSCSIPF